MNKMIKDGLTKTVEFGGKCVAFVLPIVATAFLSKMSNRMVDKIQYGGNVGYDDAVREILNCDMMASYRKEAIALLSKHGDADYYRSVIYAVNSDMMGSYRVGLIKDLTEGLKQEEGLN